MAENITSGGMSLMPGGMSMNPKKITIVGGGGGGGFRNKVSNIVEQVRRIGKKEVPVPRFVSNIIHHPLHSAITAFGLPEVGAVGTAARSVEQKSLSRFVSNTKNFIFPPVQTFKQLGTRIALGAITFGGLLEARKLGKVAAGAPVSTAIPNPNEIVGSLGAGLSFPGVAIGYGEEKLKDLFSAGKNKLMSVGTPASPDLTGLKDFINSEKSRFDNAIGQIQLPQIGMPQISAPSIGGFAPSLSVGGGGGGVAELALIAALLGGGLGFAAGRRKKKKRKYKKKRKRR